MRTKNVYIDFGGSAPALEPSAIPSTRGYRSRARAEARVYIELIRRTCGREPAQARLGIGDVQSETGTVITVVCWFHPWNSVAEAYADRCCSEAPLEWDAIARKVLRIRRLRIQSGAFAHE